RKAVQSTLAPRAKALLKAHHRLLNPPVDSLPAESKKKLEELLGYSDMLRGTWEWKEAFTTWYDHSPNVEVATSGFNRWCKQGDQI
ncbi:DesA/ISL3 alpha bundle tail domain-containing protein, partial [Paenibacillus periandrae]|uniref:DesA/ISL3 alpha bundle tail domain-containing protein n=1 Tax=Paenibacillus periandrae TaxID=1761741 RepID=UPI003B833BAA